MGVLIAFIGLWFADSVLVSNETADAFTESRVIGGHAMRSCSATRELTRVETLLEAVIHGFADICGFATIEVELTIVGLLSSTSVQHILGVSDITGQTQALGAMVDCFALSVGSTRDGFAHIDTIENSGHSLTTNLRGVAVDVRLAHIASDGLTAVDEIISIAIESGGAEALSLVIRGPTDRVFTAFDVKASVGALASVGHIRTTDTIDRTVLI